MTFLDYLKDAVKWGSLQPLFKAVADRLKGIRWDKIPVERDEDIPEWRKKVYQNKASE
jgi:hypothetical protein